MKTFFLRPPLTVICLLLVHATAALADTEIEVLYTVASQGAPEEGRHRTRYAIQAYVADPGGPGGGGEPLPWQQALFNNSGPAASESFWTLERGKKPVKFRVQTYPAQSSIKLVIMEEISADDVFVVGVKDGHEPGDMLLPGYKLTNTDAVRSFTLPPVAQEDASFIGGQAVTPNFAVQNGEDGVFTLQWFYGYDDWTSDQAHRSFKALLDANVTLHPEDEGRFLSEVNAEVDWLHLFPDADLLPDGRLHALEQLGVSARMESDQLFDNTNISAGITSWTALNGSIIQALGKGLCVLGTKPRVVPSPIVNLSYELVEKINLDAESEQQGIEDTTSRVRLQFYWSILFGHKVPVFWTDKQYDLHAVVNTGIAYDFRNETTVPDVNLSLELSPSEPSKSVPTLALTYVNGKTSTKFENYSELLGGLKWRW